MPNTPSAPFDETVTSTTSFEEYLGRVLLGAIRNDIDPRGSWVYRNGSGTPDFEVKISELTPADGRDT